MSDMQKVVLQITVVWSDFTESKIQNNKYLTPDLVVSLFRQIYGQVIAICRRSPERIILIIGRTDIIKGSLVSDVIIV
jgi:hypothetical protein